MFTRGAGPGAGLRPATAIAIIAMAWWWSGLAGAQTNAAATSAEPWDQFSADVIVRHGVASSEDGDVMAVPEVKYQWTRSRGGSGWKTKLTLKSVARPPVRTLDGTVAGANPSPVAWIEDDEDGSPLRLYNARGEQIRPPGVADRRVLGDPIGGLFKFPRLPVSSPATGARLDGSADEAESVVFVADRKERRREALRQRFGEVAGRVKGLDRYLKHSGDSTIEVLVDPDWAVPAEINLLKDGSLISHTTCSYQPGVEGSLISRSVRGEHRIANGPLARILNEVEFTNVRIERRRR